MMTGEERKEIFIAELAELLSRHKAELTISDDGKGYGMQTGIATITMPASWDNDGNISEDFYEFELPGYMP